MKTDQLSELQAMIQGTMKVFSDRKQCWKAMQAIQWRLRSADGRYVQEPRLWGGRATLGPVESALVFDGRDNEELKLRFYSARTRTELFVEILPQLVNA